MTNPGSTVSFRLVLLILALVYLASILVVHFRGRERLGFRRQAFDHSGFFAPYNVLMYAFSKVPNAPFPDRARFACLDPLRDNWQGIREEALRLFDEGFIKAAERNNDASFASFFKAGWKRFYLTWYGEPLASAAALCPNTVALLGTIPEVKAAMFALLPPGSKLNPHRDPFAGSLRYHLGLATPNSDACRIVVDGEQYSWRDGEDVVFDETFVHWAENTSDQTRVILFCDVERPLRLAPLAAFNRWLGGVLGRATATDNVGGEHVGIVNRLYALADRMGERRKRFKRAAPRTYQATRIVLALVLVGWLAWPWLGRG
ncbi:MAG: aspartyl/asparaginyl beta-hydroxylase domain-containing protein [Xanthomonadales bacterium]|nr:aspartyl/asparaginyl beta-hydroxylase domain-containing protein [Xanthomonadales bacterium]